MHKIKITSWNIEHLDRLLTATSSSTLKRKQGILDEISRINPDVICLLEGPNGEADIDQVCSGIFNNQYLPVKAADGIYEQSGTQWVWFLVRSTLINQCSLLPMETWFSFTGGETWQ